MNTFSLRSFIALSLFAVSACSYFNKREHPENKNIKRIYYPDGKLYKEIEMKSGRQTGAYREYFKNGRIFQELTFVNNKRVGVARKYYESGILYEEIPYKEGMIHGVVKRYRRTGELMAEIPYFESKLCKGLKEYTTDGKLKVRYPEIVFKETDNIKRDGTFKLEVSLSDDTKGNVEYYEGELTKEKFIGSDASKASEIKDGVGIFTFNIAPGLYIMKDFHIIAKVKTVQGNYYITEGVHRLALENR